MKVQRMTVALAAILTCGLIMSHNVRSGDDPKKKGKEGKTKTDKKVKKTKIKPIVIKGTLSRNDPYDYVRSSSYHKIHKVRLKKDVFYGITMTSTFTPYVRLEDFRGNHLYDQNYFTGRTATITHTPDATDEFRIVASSYSSNNSGNYTITIKPVEVYFRKKGSLTVKDKLDNVRGGCYSKRYKIKLVKGNNYTFRADFTCDGYLRLEDSNKRQLTFNDDWGGTVMKSRMVYTPTKNGTYTIIVTTCGARTTGNFNLWVLK